MVKKRLRGGEPCKKCAQAEQMLRKRGLWERIDEVVWAVEDEPDSAGFAIAARHAVDVAPFFVVADEAGAETIYTSALRMVKTLFPAAKASNSNADPDAVAAEFEGKPPQELIKWALSRYGADCAIAFSGAEDVALIDMASKTGLPFSVFSLDTGRLHPETYEFIDRVRAHYGIEIAVHFPEAAAVEQLVRTKGLFSFFDDGHTECCSLRKVAPLRRALGKYHAWINGQRRDQNPETRGELAVAQWDSFKGAGAQLLKLNPLAAWTSEQVWSYIRDNQVPYNRLHDDGFRSIGCAPCTRPVGPDQHEREGRWWWEQSGKRECGLHSATASATEQTGSQTKTDA